LGFAGLHTAGEAEGMAVHIREYAREIHVSNDADLVLAGLDGEVGVALIAGTGSIALGRSIAGQRAQVGGWGHILGDEGSGYDIGRRGLQAAVRAADGRDAPTLLLDLVLRRWRLATPNDLVAEVYQHTSYEQEKAAVAHLAPLVLRAAEAGDATARRILSHAAGELSLLAVTAIDALDAGAQPVSLAVGGGLLTNAHELRASVLARIRRRRRLARVSVVAEPALAAARSLAARVESAHLLASFSYREV
jgi:N-acetylglucosamine kinase-like BadF-type ATPase